nr:DUF87 domain-containing protein [Lachnospiraceae bacterium]
SDETTEDTAKKPTFKKGLFHSGETPEEKAARKAEKAAAKEAKKAERAAKKAEKKEQKLQQKAEKKAAREEKREAALAAKRAKKERKVLLSFEDENPDAVAGQEASEEATDANAAAGAESTETIERAETAETSEDAAVSFGAADGDLADMAASDEMSGVSGPDASIEQSERSAANGSELNSPSEKVKSEEFSGEASSDESSETAGSRTVSEDVADAKEEGEEADRTSADTVESASADTAESASADTAESTEPTEQELKAQRAEKVKEQNKKWKSEIRDAVKTQKQIKREERARERARIKEENRILRSPNATDEEREAAWAARMERAVQKKQEKEARQDDSTLGLFMENLMAFTDIRDNRITYADKYFGAVIEIMPIAFGSFSEEQRKSVIENGLGKILRSIPEEGYVNLIKLDRPIRYDKFLDREYDRLDELKIAYENGELQEEQLKARVEVLYDRINDLQRLCFEDKVITPHYYLAIFDRDPEKLERLCEDALLSLEQGLMDGNRLDTRELAIFLKYSNQLDFEERDIEWIDPEDYAQWAMPDVVKFKSRSASVSHMLTRTYRVYSYPGEVNDAYLAKVMSIPSTKVVIKLRQVEQHTAIAGIDQSLQELRSRYAATSAESKLMKLGEHIASLGDLLETLYDEHEVLMDANIYVTTYDVLATENSGAYDMPKKSLRTPIEEMDKTVCALWKEAGFKLMPMDFNQLDGFVASQVSAFDPGQGMARGIPSNSMAAALPWIYPLINDVGGVKLGLGSGVPVYLDLFKKDEAKAAGSLVMTGRSGAGKTYAIKSMIAALACTDTRICILDPDLEYQELVTNLHGKVVNMSNVQKSRINPLQIPPELLGPRGNGYSEHLDFLKRFYELLLPDYDPESISLLMALTEKLYRRFGITPDQNLARLRPEDFPILDDLYDQIGMELSRTAGDEKKGDLRSLRHAIAEYSLGGKNADLWNGKTLLDPTGKLTVFQFKSMLQGGQRQIALAQEMLLLRWLENEALRLSRLRKLEGHQGRLLVVLDEALYFADEKYPMAFDEALSLSRVLSRHNGSLLLSMGDLRQIAGNEEAGQVVRELIKSCTYRMLFTPLPSEMEELCKLFEGERPLSEEVQKTILDAPKGACCLQADHGKSVMLSVEVFPVVSDMIRQKKYASHYFAQEEGRQNWEEFVSESREAYQTSIEENRLALLEEEERLKRARNRRSYSSKTIEDPDAFMYIPDVVEDLPFEDGLSKEASYEDTESDAAELAKAYYEEGPDIDAYDVSEYDTEYEADDEAEYEADDEAEYEADYEAEYEAAYGEDAYEEEPYEEDGYGADDYATDDYAADGYATDNYATNGYTTDYSTEGEGASYDDGFDHSALFEDEKGYVYVKEKERPQRVNARRERSVRGVQRDPAQDQLLETINREKEQISRLQKELEQERARMERERLDSQRQILAMERAVFEAQKNNSMQEAFVSLSETLKQMQQMMASMNGAAQNSGQKDTDQDPKE